MTEVKDVMFEVSEKANGLVVQYGTCAATYIAHRNESSESDYEESYLKLLIYIGTLEKVIEKNKLVKEFNDEINRLREVAGVQVEEEEK